VKKDGRVGEPVSGLQEITSRRGRQVKTTAQYIVIFVLLPSSSAVKATEDDSLFEW
jgi:hypothetical protein